MRYVFLVLLLAVTGCSSNRPQTLATPAFEFVARGSYDEVYQSLLDAITGLGFVPKAMDRDSGIIVAEHNSAPGETRELWLDCGRQDALLGGPNFAKVWNLYPTLSAYVSRGEGNAHSVRLDVSGTAYAEAIGMRGEQPCVSLRVLESQIADQIRD